MDMFIADNNTLIYSLLLAFFRPLGMFVIMPILSSKNLGGSMIRNGMILMLLLPVMPIFYSEQQQIPSNISWYTVMLYGKEFIIGVLIGFIAAIPFWALDSASYVIDTMRGSSMATVLNPSLGESSTIFGVFFTQLLAAIFFAFGGLHQLTTAFYHSYQLFPPGSELHFDKVLLLFIKQQWELLFSLLFSFALPAIGVMLLVDIGLGLINRSVQQLNVFFLAMPIKSALVLLLLMISLPYSIRHYQQHLVQMGDYINTLWRLLR
jgi:type III secretion protein T